MTAWTKICMWPCASASSFRCAISAGAPARSIVYGWPLFFAQTKQKQPAAKDSAPATREQTCEAQPGASPAVALPPTLELESLALFGLYLLALAWPLGAYQRIAGPVHLHHVALAPVFACTLHDWMRNKRLRTPFELWWPCVLLALLAGVLYLGGYPTMPWRLAGCAFTAIAVIHVARNRGVILWSIQLSVVGGAAMLLLSVLARAGVIFPTAYARASGLVMAGQYGIAEGVFASTALILVLPALIQARRAREFNPKLIYVFVWVLLPVLAAWWLFWPPRPALRAWHPEHNFFLFPVVFLAVLTLWMCARVAARQIIARHAANAGAAHGALAVALIAAVIAAFVLAPRPEIGPVFLLALSAAYAGPGTTRTLQVPPKKWLAAPILLALVVNLTFILPGDPRDYEHMARRALARGDHAALREELRFIKTLAPEERRADYYLAWTWLAENNLPAAATAFGQAMRPGRARLLPAPGADDVDAFLTEMRDRSSALPERIRGLAYEQSLIAAGREQHALSLLELRGETTLQATMPVWPLAMALAATLEAPHMADTFRGWAPGLLLAVLESAGPFNRVSPAPNEMPRGQLPFIAMARAEKRKLSVHVFSPAGTFGGVLLESDRSAPVQDIGVMFAESGWGRWRQNAAGEWILPFGLNAVVRIGNTPQVHFHQHVALPEDLPIYLWELQILVPAENHAHE